MERITSINPERIKLCCESLGITLDDFFRDMEKKISSLTLEKIQKGLTFKQLSAIADYLGQGVLFFIGEDPVDEMEVYSPHFRTLTNQKPNLSRKLRLLIKRVEEQRDIYQGLCEDLEDIDFPIFNPPDMRGKTVAEAARITHQWLGLDLPSDKKKHDFNVYRTALQSRGIMVFLSNAHEGKWQFPKEETIIGFSLHDKVCPVIMVRKEGSTKTRQSFTLIHELGHLLLHQKSWVDDDQDIQEYYLKEEREANEFAGHVLVPDSFLNDVKDEDRPLLVSKYDKWLEPQRERWGVSAEVILRRLLDCGRLEGKQYQNYREYRQERSKETSESEGTNQREQGMPKRYRYLEPKNIFGDTFVRTVLDAMYERHITLTKASSYLDNLKIEDLHKLEKKYVHV